MTGWLLIAGSLVLLVALLAAVSHLARRFELDREVARKAIHVGLGLYCLTFPWLFQRTWQVVAVCAAAFLVLAAVRTVRALRQGVGAGLLGVARRSHGDLLFAVAVALVFVLQKGEVVAYLVPLAILTLSDAAAALVGTHYGRRVFTVEGGRKSWEGAAMFFLTAWLITMVMLLLLSDAPRLNVVVLGLIVAVYGTSVEATSWHGLDNLFVPMALNLLLAQHLNATAPELLAGAALFALALALISRYAVRLGLELHAAYFLATLLATIAMASTWWNMILPLAVLLCHALARRQGTTSGALHMGLAILGISLFWYLVNDLTGMATVYAYNLTLATYGAALLILVARGRALALIALVTLWGMVHGIAMAKEGEPHVATGLMLVGLALPSAACAMVGFWRPWFVPAWPLRICAPSLGVGLAVLPLVQP